MKSIVRLGTVEKLLTNDYGSSVLLEVETGTG